MIDTIEHRSGVQFQTDADVDVHSGGIEVARVGNPNNRSVTPAGALALFPSVDVEFYTLNGVKHPTKGFTMAIQLEANYSKKLVLPRYSSHQ